MMSTHTFLPVILLSARAFAQEMCADLDTQACVRMYASQPDMCNTPLGDTACPRFCQKCLVPTCADIDTQACELMHDGNPNVCDEPSIAEFACKSFCGKCALTCHFCHSLVDNMSQCTQTELCQTDQNCYTMEVFDFTKSHGFRGGCISKDLCVPQTYDPEVFGRSTSTVKMSCCNTNRCNKEIATKSAPSSSSSSSSSSSTSTATTTTTTTTRPTTRPTTTRPTTRPTKPTTIKSYMSYMGHHNHMGRKRNA